MESATRTHPFNFVPLMSHGDIEGNAHYITLMCRQLLFRPVGTIPPEAIRFIAAQLDVSSVNVEALFNHFTPLEAHALHIRMVGWEMHYLALRQMSTASVIQEGGKVLDQITATRENIQRYAHAYEGSFCNFLKWIQIRIPALLLDPASNKDLSQKSIAKKTFRNPDTQEKMQVEATKKFAFDCVISLCESISFAIDCYLRTSDPKFFVHVREANKKWKEQVFEIFDATLVSDVNRELSDLIAILRCCIVQPEELVPLLLVEDESNDTKEFFPRCFPELLHDIGSVHHYYGQEILQKFRVPNFPHRELKSLQRFIHDGSEIVDLFHQEWKNFSTCMTHQNLFGMVKTLDSLDCLQEKFNSYSSRYFEFLEKTKGALKLCQNSKELIEYYDRTFHKYTMYLMNILQEMLTKGSFARRKMNEVSEICCFGTPISLKEYPSKLFTPFDLHLLEMEKRGSKIVELIPKEPESQENPILDKLDLIVGQLQQCFLLSTAKVKKLKVFDIFEKDPVKKDITEDYLKMGQSLLCQDGEELSLLGDQQDDVIRKAIEAYVGNLKQCCSLYTHLESFPELYSLMLQPLSLKESGSLSASPTELRKLKERLQQVIKNILYHYDEHFFIRIRDTDRKLDKKNDSYHIHYVTAYTSFLHEWLKSIYKIDSAIHDGEALPKCINLYLNALNKHLQFLYSQPVTDKIELFLYPISVVKNNYLETCKPLFRYHTLQKLIESSKKKSASQKKKRSKARQNRQKQQKSQTPFFASKPSSPITLVPLRRVSAVDFHSHSALEKKEASLYSLKAFQKQWQEGSIKKKLMILLNLSEAVPQVIFIDVRHRLPSKEEDLLYSIKTEAVSNLKESMEDLLLLHEATGFRKLDRSLFSLQVLKLAVIAEQALKLLFSQKFNPEEHFHSHKPSLLYQSLMEREKDNDLLPLPRLQEEWLETVDQVLSISSRYQGCEWLDFLTQKAAQMQYISTISSASLSKEEQRVECRNLSKMIGIPQEENETFPLLLSKAEEFLQEEIQYFLTLGMETVKNLLLALDPTLMTNPRECVLSIPKKEMRLREIYGRISLLRCQQQKQDSKTSSQNVMENLQQELTLLNDLCLVSAYNNLVLSPELESLMQNALIECQSAFQCLQGLFLPRTEESCTLGRAHAILLNEAVIVERTLYLIMAAFPYFNHNQPEIHLLLSHYKGKLFWHRHALQQCAKIISAEIQRQLPQFDEFALFEERIKMLEPILKKFYRYRGNGQESAQVQLDQFRFLDQLGFLLEHKSLESHETESLEKIAEEFSHSFSANHLKEIAQELLEREVMRPCFITLQHVKLLLKMLREKLNASFRLEYLHQ